jgi:hypothetical protein
MNFYDWVSLRMEGEAAHKIGEPPMRLVGGAPMSQAGFKAAGLPHGEYQPKNFDRYPFRPDEAKVEQYLDKIRKVARNDMLVCIEALAGYYGNDGIVRAYDDFLTELGRQNIRF